MNKLSITLSTLVLLAAAFSAHSFAQAQSQPANPPSVEDQFTAIALARLLNTAEIVYWQSTDNGATEPHHRFSTLSDLYSSGALETVKPRIQDAPDVWSLISADGIQGYKFALIVSPDGKSYQFALHDTKPENALYSVFSDQSGIIYTGSPLR